MKKRQDIYQNEGRKDKVNCVWNIYIRWIEV